MVEEGVVVCGAGDSWSGRSGAEGGRTCGAVVVASREGFGVVGGWLGRRLFVI